MRPNKRLDFAPFGRPTAVALRTTTADQAWRCTSERRLIQV